MNVIRQSRKLEIKPLTRLGLHIQGYSTCTDRQLGSYAFGIRFAYGTCGLLVLLGVVFQDTFLYVLSGTISIGGVLLSRHPVDFLYNAFIRHLINLPAIPKRSPQNRFACFLATLWLGMMIGCSLTGYTVMAGILAGAMLMQITIVTTTDICFPSMIYNFLNKPL